MAYPQHFDIVEVINKMQRKYIGKIDHELANKQYNELVNLLISNGVKVQFLNLVESPEQVFTRDIGFVIDNVLFVSHMKKEIRQEEPSSLQNFFDDTDFKVHVMANHAEGGDIFIHHDYILIGLSRRTSKEAVQEIRDVLKQHGIQKEIIEVNFNPDQLHLDCVFNILDEETCIISDQVYNPEVIKPLFKKVIEIKGKDVEYLATNFVHIGNKKMVCTNHTMTKILENAGYEPIYLDYSEFIKSGGSARCCTLPILRK